MVIDRSKVKRILVISLSNVGDVILTTPVVRTLEAYLPDARIDVMVGPNGAEVFAKDPAVSKVIVFDKHAVLIEKRRLVAKLRGLKYDLVVDLRNTIFGLLLGPPYRTSTIQVPPSGPLHKKEEHLYKLASLGIEQWHRDLSIHLTRDDEGRAADLLAAEGVRGDFVAVAPGAKGILKRWPEDAFAILCDRIISETGHAVVLVGLGEDADIVKRILKKVRTKPIDLVDRTTLRELASVFKRARLVITNDSAPLHLGCAVRTKVLAIFGPTDSAKYGPTGPSDAVIRKDLSCAPCEASECLYEYECMRSITVDEVYDAAARMLGAGGASV